ncbi:uncharacterized protein V3H82_027163 [Fundulus diaphanus]
MEQQSNQVDVESLRSSAPRRGSCVDVFLGLSIVFLFVAVTGLAVGGMLVTKELRAELRSVSQPIPASPVQLSGIGDSPSSAYKMHNFAYLKPKKSALENCTMPWTSISYDERTSLGSNFEYNSLKYSLKPKKKGIYFIYIQVTVSCTSHCKAGVLKLELLNKLTCNVELTADIEKTPVSKKCWTVGHLDSQDLTTQVTVPEEGLENWRLELNSSGLGMFLIE